MPKNEEIKQRTLNQRNAEESKHKMMSPGVEVKATIKSSDGPVRYSFDLDVDYITERVIAMSFPSGGPEAQYRSNLKDVVGMLKTKHQNHYIIFNLSKRRNDIIKMNEQVLDVGWHDSLAPPLERLCSICKQIETWMKKDPQNVVVLHCKGSRSPIGVVVLAYMNYISITANSETSLDRYAMKRFMEAKTDRHVQPSQFRYEEYFTGLLTGAISINSAPLYLHHIVIHGVPNYDANGGCRPFLRIYQGMQTVYTSGVYTVPEGTTKFVIDLDKALPLRGDILVKCYHKKFRSSTRDVIFRCQFHTTAVVEYRLLFGKEDLDDACTDARFHPFTKVEFIFSATADRLHNSDYVSNSNFPVDNNDDPLIRWDSYENFSKLIEGIEFEPDSPHPNGGNNNNLPPESTKYIYAQDGSPYAQVQKTPTFSNSPQEPTTIQQTRVAPVHQARPSAPQTNGPISQNPHYAQNGPTGSPSRRVPVTSGSPAGRGVERSPSGRQMDFKEQQQLEELLRGIEDGKGFEVMMNDNNNKPMGSPKKSPMVESPGNRRIVSVHAELKNAPLSMKKASPARPIVEEEFENSPTNVLTENSPPPYQNGGQPIEEAILPQQVKVVQSAPPFRELEKPQAREPVPNYSNNMQPLPNGNVLRDEVPLEHANPTYDYTEQGNPQRTGEIEEPIMEVRLKAAPVQLQPLDSLQRTASAPSKIPANRGGSYQPQPLRAQQQKIKFITKYDDSPDGRSPSPGQMQVPSGQVPSHNISQGPSLTVGPSQPSSHLRPSDDGYRWLQRQQDKLKEQKGRDHGPQYQYSSPLQVHEPGVQPSYQRGVYQSAPLRTDLGVYPPGTVYSTSEAHSPSSSVKSEPVTSNRPYPPDNLSWLEQQQQKLRERKHQEKLQIDPSYPLLVNTNYDPAQFPSQPSSISSIRSDVSGYSNTPYSQRLPEPSMGIRRGYYPEPLTVSQPPPQRGPPTPASGYDNMSTTPRQGVVSPPSGGLLETRPLPDQRTSTPKRSQSLTREPMDGARLIINEPVAKPKGDMEAENNANNSSNVYSPNTYSSPGTSLPSQPSTTRPVNRSNSLGGYESDSAIQYKPSRGEAESWMQNPGGLPSQESEYWNRIEGLRSPDDKSPRDMHSSNESLPNGGITPKFPVGPKGYANMVRTCIAVVGKPPHGPDEPIPLSPSNAYAPSDVMDTSLPKYPEPARKMQSNPRPAQEPPLQVRHLEPGQVQLREIPDRETPSYPVQVQVDRVPSQTPQYVESQPRAPMDSAQSRPLAQTDHIDVKSLEALLESVSPVEARGGVPDRPTSPGSYPDKGEMGGYPSHRPQVPEIHYAEVEIEPSRRKEKPRPTEPVSYAHVHVQPRQDPYQPKQEEIIQPSVAGDVHTKPYQTVRPNQPTYQPSPQYPVTQPTYHTVPVSQQPHPVQETISMTHLSPVKVVLQDLPLDKQQHRPAPAATRPIDAQIVVENRQQVVNSSPANVLQHEQPSQPMTSQGYPSHQIPPTSTQDYSWQPTSQPASRSPNAQHVVPQYMQQPQRAVINQPIPQQQQQVPPQHMQYKSPSLVPQHATQQHVAPQQAQQQYAPPQFVAPQQAQQQYAPPQFVAPQQAQQQHAPPQFGAPQQAQQQHAPQQVQPSQQTVPQRIVYTQEVRKQTVPSQHDQPLYQQPIQQQQPLQQQPLQHYPQPMQHQKPHLPLQQQPLYQQPQVQPRQSPESEPPSISLSEATPPPKHIGLQEPPIFSLQTEGEESSNAPNLQNLETRNAPPPLYPTYSDRMKNRPQPLYPTFSDRHRRGHARVDELFAGAPNGNYRTLYDNRGGSRGTGSSGSDGSAVSPGTTSPVRQAVSPSGQSPSPSGRSTPSNFYLMPYTSPYSSNSSLADPNKEHVRFVKDLSAWWYRPHISREEAINLLRDKQPGTFVVRDSNSFPGAFGLAIKVSQPPANAPPKKGSDPCNELIRHFLIEPNARGVRLKGCANEPIFGSLSSLIYQHTLTQLALPCKLVLPDSDPVGVDSPDAIDPKSAAALLQQGAACNVLYLQCLDMESLTGPSAVREAITRVMSKKDKPKGVKVHFKVSLKGVTLTDSGRKLFFRKHYPVRSILYCGMDSGSRKFPRMEGQDDPDAKCFGFVCRKPGSLTDNQCMVFAEYEMEQPASAIVSFVTKVLLGSKQMKTP